MIDSLVKDFDSLPKLWRNNLIDCIQIEESQVCISVETGLGHPGHIFSGSSRSDPVYNLSGSDPDWIT